MKKSKELLELLQDVAGDHEFQFDYDLGYNVDSNVKFILNTPKVLKVVLTGIKSDYDHDIAMEEADGEDVKYLKPILNEVESLLKDL